MAIKLATVKRKTGDIIHFQTSTEQVVGLDAALAAKQAALTQEQLDAVNSGATAALIGKITTTETAVNEIKEVIPSQATEENPLVTQEFVNSSLNASAAHFVSYDATNSNFPTKAALLASTTWYYAGEAYVPHKNDYLVVLADEDYDGAQTRYIVVADFTEGTAPTIEIQLQYIINDAPFTAAQNAAINSGATAEKIAKIDEMVTATEAAATYASKEEIEGLGTVYYVAAGADLSGFDDDDLIIEIQD